MISGFEDFVICAVRATTVSVPLEAPLRHATGAHWGRFVRTLVEVETSDGLIGVGELGGGGESAEAAIAGVGAHLRGHSPFALEALAMKVSNPTATLYGNRTQLHAALEFACLDLIGQRLGVPVSALIGGAVRERVPFASYLFFRYPNPETGATEIRTPEQVVAYAQRMRRVYGFETHKLKGGVYPVNHELECYRALAAAVPADRLRYDPNCALSLPDSLRVIDAIADLPNDYLEDPTWGMEGLRRLRRPGLLLATNTVVVNFEQLAANIRDPAADVILLDTTFWGGIRACLKAAAVCATVQLPVAVHSSGELGVQLATMLHLAAVLPSLPFALDSHYHHLCDDVIEGGKLPCAGGEIAVPSEPGLGVRLDPERVAHYAEEYRRLGPYPYDRDPGRPDWFATVPGTDWDDPRRELHPVPCTAASLTESTPG